MATQLPGLRVIAGLAAAGAAVAAVLVRPASQAHVIDAYDWLAAHPYTAVIGGMALYLCVLLSFSHLCFQADTTAQFEELRRKAALHERWQHLRRLRAWQQRHPEAAAAAEASEEQQRRRHQQQQPHRWGGALGFGPQQLAPADAAALEAAAASSASSASSRAAAVVQQVLAAHDFFEVLSVPWGGGATARVLRAARKARVLAVHPDKAGRGLPGAALAMSRVNAAYATLADPSLCAAYDEWLAQQH
jgi:hypothetical protein